MESGPPPWRRHFGRRAGHRPLLGAVVDAGLATGVAAGSVAAARDHGHTWTQIATMLGTSRQAAQERYGEPANRP
jgi:hypothetical protein